jgi:hypothetical protein
MKRIAGALLLALWVLPMHAADAPSGCAWLCGSWVLDADHSESAEGQIDAALAKYKTPKPRRAPRPDSSMGPMGPMGPGGARGPQDDEDAGPPPFTPPSVPQDKSSLRAQLLGELAASASLVVGQEGEAILMRAADGAERRAYPGTPHSLTNSSGTTKIVTTWKSNALVVREDRGGRRKFTETFALQADGNLQVTRVLQHPGLKELRVSAIYRRGQTQRLESVPQGRPQ